MVASTIRDQVLQPTLQGGQPARRRVAVWRARHSGVQPCERAGARGTCTSACAGQCHAYTRWQAIVSTTYMQYLAACLEIPGCAIALGDGQRPVATVISICLPSDVGGPEVHVQRQEPGHGVVCTQLLLPVRSPDMLQTAPLCQLCLVHFHPLQVVQVHVGSQAAARCDVLNIHVDPAAFKLLRCGNVASILCFGDNLEREVKYFTETEENSTMMAPRNAVPYFL